MMRIMIMATKTCVRVAALAAATLATAGAAVSSEGELSDKSVQVLMDYAWALTPQQFSKKDGTIILVDKQKREASMVPLDVAREVIRVGRLSAHAQVCNLPEDQTLNHRSLMRRETDKLGLPGICGCGCLGGVCRFAESTYAGLRSARRCSCPSGQRST